MFKPCRFAFPCRLALAILSKPSFPVRPERLMGGDWRNFFTTF